MALNIRNQETERLADQLSQLTGESKTRAVTLALRERQEKVKKRSAKRYLTQELDDIALHCASLPVLDQRPADEILGYDEIGLPD